MRSSWSLALPFLCPLIVAATADEARVLLFPNTHKDNPVRGQKLDAETARLVFSRRLGLSDLYDLGSPSEQQIEQINKLGGEHASQLLGLQQRTFANQKGQGVVIVQGFENADDLVPSIGTGAYDEFTISSSPTTDETLELMHSFEQQLKHQYANDESYRTRMCATVHGVVAPYDFSNTGEMCKPWSFSKVTDVKDLDTAQGVKSDLARLTDAITDGGYPFIIVFLPPQSSTARKRSANAYGDIKPRQGQQAPEMVLTDTTVSHSVHNSFTTPLAVAKDNSTGPVGGILPSCFSSKADCESKTNTCSGHGECYMKWNLTTPENKESTSCFACACNKDTKDGKTTYWAGSACQKKDISVPFWIFVGFTIAFLSILTWAISLLYTMGNEELPSVIGAGVSGPTKK